MNLRRQVEEISGGEGNVKNDLASIFSFDKLNFN